MKRVALVALLVAWSPPAPAGDGGQTPRITDPYQAERAERPGLHLGEWFRLRGYFRLRGLLLNNLDLNRGEQPSTGRPIAPVPLHEPEVNDTLNSADLRARLEPSFWISPEVGLHLQIDLLDNLVLGSTPAGFPAAPDAAAVEASVSQVPPTSGLNSLSDSIAVKRAYADILTPIGLLSFGRMGHHWGMGLLAHSGDGIDDDVGFTVDRIGFATSLFEHVVGVSYDFNANGPSTASSTAPVGPRSDVDDSDDVRTISLAILKKRPAWALRRLARADRWAFDYGVVGSFRWQTIDFPSFHTLGVAGEERDFTSDESVPRGLTTWLLDLWLRVSGPTVRLEAEGVYLRSRVDDTSRAAGVSAPALDAEQYGLAVRLGWQPVNRLNLAAETGLASGDPAPGMGTGRPTGLVRTANGDLDGPQIDVHGGDTRVDNYRFHPAYQIDELLWRRIIGTVTDAFYVKASASVSAMDSLVVDTSVIYSQTLEAASAPGLARPLGVEWNLSVQWLNPRGYRLGLTYALLVPLEGLGNRAPERSGDPAHGLRAMAAVEF